MPFLGFDQGRFSPGIKGRHMIESRYGIGYLIRSYLWMLWVFLLQLRFQLSYPPQARSTFLSHLSQVFFIGEPAEANNTDHPLKKRPFRHRGFRRFQGYGCRVLGGNRIPSRNEFYALDTQLVVERLSESAKYRSKDEPRECTTSPAC
jgi:hypothetical protein